MPRCVKCGMQLEEDNKFCTHCGQSITESVKVSYCEKCGMQLEEDNKFCTQCGQPVTESVETEQPIPNDIEIEQPVPEVIETKKPVSEDIETEQPVIEGVEMVQSREEGSQAINETEEEQYLGGLASADLHPRGRGTKMNIGGCGLYATNKRIIVIRSKKGFVKLVGIIAPIAGVVGSHASKSAMSIAELEEKKEFEVKKEDIAEIEMILIKGMGFQTFTLNSGEKVKILITNKKIFNVTRDLMKLFYPERLKLEENVRKRLDRAWFKEWRSSPS